MSRSSSRRARRPPRRSLWLVEILDAIELRAGLLWGTAAIVGAAGAVMAWRFPTLVPPLPLVGASIAFAGILLGLAITIIADTVDPVIRGPRHVRGTGVELVAVLPTDAHPEAAGDLVTAILDAHEGDSALKIGVAAAGTGVFGVGPWIDALAYGLADRGASVLAVDLVSGSTAKDGLAEVISGERRVAEVARIAEGGLRLARLGPGRDTKAAVNGLPRLASKLPSDLDVLLVAMPPASTREAVGATKSFDHVLIVAERDRTTVVELMSSIDAVDRVRGTPQTLLLDSPTARALGIEVQPPVDGDGARARSRRRAESTSDTDAFIERSPSGRILDQPIPRSDDSFQPDDERFGRRPDGSEDRPRGGSQPGGDLHASGGWDTAKFATQRQDLPPRAGPSASPRTAPGLLPDDLRRSFEDQSFGEGSHSRDAGGPTGRSGASDQPDATVAMPRPSDSPRSDAGRSDARGSDPGHTTTGGSSSGASGGSAGPAGAARVPGGPPFAGPPASGPPVVGGRPDLAPGGVLRGVSGAVSTQESPGTGTTRPDPSDASARATQATAANRPAATRGIARPGDGQSGPSTASDRSSLRAELRDLASTRDEPVRDEHAGDDLARGGRRASGQPEGGGLAGPRPSADADLSATPETSPGPTSHGHQDSTGPLARTGGAETAREGTAERPDLDDWIVEADEHESRTVEPRDVDVILGAGAAEATTSVPAPITPAPDTPTPAPDTPTPAPDTPAPAPDSPTSAPDAPAPASAGGLAGDGPVPADPSGQAPRQHAAAGDQAFESRAATGPRPLDEARSPRSDGLQEPQPEPADAEDADDEDDLLRTTAQLAILMDDIDHRDNG